MKIIDLIKLLETYDKYDEVKCLALVEGADFTLELEGVGTVEDDKVIYIYAKED